MKLMYPQRPINSTGKPTLPKPAACETSLGLLDQVADGSPGAEGPSIRVLQDVSQQNLPGKVLGEKVTGPSNNLVGLQQKLPRPVKQLHRHEMVKDCGNHRRTTSTGTA